MITFTTLHYTQSMKTDILHDLQHLVIFFMKILQNCWTVNEKRLGVCCRLNNEDYLDYDEEQIQIDYDNEHEKSDRKTVIPAMLPSQSITSHGKKLDNAKGNIPLFLILTKNEFNNVENMKNKRIKEKLRLIDIPHIIEALNKKLKQKRIKQNVKRELKVEEAQKLARNIFRFVLCCTLDSRFLVTLLATYFTVHNLF